MSSLIHITEKWRRAHQADPPQWDEGIEDPVLVCREGTSKLSDALEVEGDLSSYVYITCITRTPFQLLRGWIMGMETDLFSLHP
jgi:hypothetical protein